MELRQVKLGSSCTAFQDLFMYSGISFRKCSGVIFKGLLLLRVMKTYYFTLKIYITDDCEWLHLDGRFVAGLLSHEELIKVSPPCEDYDYLAANTYLVEIDTDLINNETCKYPISKAEFIQLTKRNS